MAEDPRIAALEARIEWLEDYVVAGYVTDVHIDRRRLNMDVNSRSAPVTKAVVERYKRRTRQRADRSPLFDGVNHATIRGWAANRCSLPEEEGGMRVIWKGEDRGVLRSGDHLEADPDFGRISIVRARDFDPMDVYSEVQQ